MPQSGDGSPLTPARPDAPSPEGEMVESEAGIDPGPPTEEVPVSTEDDGRRPTPVRMAMEGGEETEEEDQRRPRVIEDPESGTTWVVTVGGRSASGILPLRTVPIMELSFAKEEAPDEALKTVLCYGKQLSDVPDQDLLTCLGKSGPFREPMRPQEDRDRRGRRGKGTRPPRG
jgi:hypothetical protein